MFISDIHLGFRGCSAAYLLDFLRSVETETLYLVGDIIDVLEPAASRSSGLRQHNDVIRTILAKAKHGTRVVYIPGNHDAMFRDYDGMVFGNVEIRREAIHETADGRRLLVLHGDEFDSVIKASPLLEALGNRAYSFDAEAQSLREPAAPGVRRPVLVDRGVSQAQGEERGEVHRELRARARAGGAAPRPGRRDLRPHPSR